MDNYKDLSDNSTTTLIRHSEIYENFQASIYSQNAILDSKISSHFSIKKSEYEKTDFSNANLERQHHFRRSNHNAFEFNQTSGIKYDPNYKTYIEGKPHASFREVH